MRPRTLVFLAGILLTSLAAVAASGDGSASSPAISPGDPAAIRGTENGGDDSADAAATSDDAAETSDEGGEHAISLLYTI